MKIFISHNAIDKAIAKEIVKLLVNGIGIKKSNIFCSSADGTDVPFGEDFQDYIKNELNIGGILIALITKNYFKSTFSMYELGASWANSSKMIPIIFKPFKFGDLKDFLKHINSVLAYETKDLNKLKDELEFMISENVNTNTWEEARDEFIQKNDEIYNQEITNSTVPYLIPPKSKSKYKIVAFDLDGTILQGKNFDYSWKLVWEYLGYPDGVRKGFHKLHLQDSKSYTYADWCNDCCRYFKKKNLKREDIKTILKESKIKCAPTLKTLLTGLKECEIFTVVVSGGINTFYELAIPKDIQSLIDRVYINIFNYDSNGKLLDVKPHSTVESDFYGKLKHIKDLCSELNCSLNEVVFIGEGYNDKEIGESECFSIAYPGQKADGIYKSVADVIIEDKNICAVFPYILVNDSKKELK